MTDSGDLYLQYYGGVHKNCLNNILHSTNDETNESNSLPITKTSSYYDTDHFKSLVNTKINSFGILSTNRQSINAKFNELVAFVQELHLINYDFSIICIKESWLTEHDDLSHIQLEDYTCISLGKNSSTKGGFILYVHTRYDYKVLRIKNETWEGQLIEITGGGLKKPVIVGNIYRPPRDLNINHTQFIDEFSLLLSQLDCKNSEVIIAGDFNINLLKINDKEYPSEFYDTLTGFSFFPKITFPTRFSYLNDTLIDNLFCKLSQIMLQSTAGILIKQFSDHQPYFLFIETSS